MIAYQSTMKGLDKLRLNEQNLARDLDNAWEVLAEPIQTVMRRAGIEQPYEKLKELTRGQKITRETIRQFVKSLSLPEQDRERLLALTPANYTGIAGTIVEMLD